jgi:hypothetical protein
VLFDLLSLTNEVVCIWFNCLLDRLFLLLLFLFLLGCVSILPDLG